MDGTIFLSKEFWNDPNWEKNIDSHHFLLDLFDALKNNNVVTDLPNESLLTGKKEYGSGIRNNLFALLQRCKYSGANGKIIYDADRFKEIRQNNVIDLHATYLLDKEIYNLKIEDRFGVVTLFSDITSDTMLKNWYLFKGDGFLLNNKKNRIYGERYMTTEFKKHLRRPCNSLIIIDPYILGEAKDAFPGISSNLKSLLNAIIPQKLDVDFHITLISSWGISRPDLEEKTETQQDELRAKIEEEIKMGVSMAHSEMMKCIAELGRDEVNIQFGIFYADRGYNYRRESFHSRHIISNTFMIDAEDGFDLFNDKGYIRKNNPVIMMCYPRLCGDSRKDMTKYENWIRSAKKHVDEIKEGHYMGAKDNRLFDLVK